MTNKESIEVINKECESTFMTLHCSIDFVKALCRIITTVENIDKVREEYKANLEYAKEVGDVDFIVAYSTVLETFDKYLGDKEVE